MFRDPRTSVIDKELSFKPMQTYRITYLIEKRKMFMEPHQKIK